MEIRPLLITPPFTQLNTPYPATAYLKGFLNTLGISSLQCDLGIEVILAIFSKAGLEQLFSRIDAYQEMEEDIEISENAFRIYGLRTHYLRTIEPVISFLQHKNPTLAHAICSRSYLPEARRFEQIDDLEWAFGAMGTHDKARHLATLYLEDIGDLIQELIDPHFGFSRYAERLGRSATHFTPLLEALEAPNSWISNVMLQILEEKIRHAQPTVVCISVPFPGNLFGALKCGQYLKAKYPDIKIVMGGGYCNTELRSVSDERVFNFVDYICLDDGEAPLQILFEYLEGKRHNRDLKRVFHLNNGVVQFGNGATEKDIAQRETGTPDYSDLMLGDYLSVIEIANPMHRLWSDGRWNKLTLAHGCYWGKCSFCDVSLDYIARYEPIDASILCDRIAQIIKQTGQYGFHFVDEAAPPALLRDLSLEILQRGLTVVWWVNIRFEKSFTPDLCKLMKAAGCIAVSGGLEVASDRLLEKMKKGVTVAQVAQVGKAFTDAGVMVHAYLMYGFPTQTAQETVDSLEMVRQMFAEGVINSGFWHLFAMTAHSPVGLDPMSYGVQRTGPEPGGFADNDLAHEDPEGADHERFSEGLKVSLFNYMHGAGLDFPLHKWFDFKIPKTSVPPRFIQRALLATEKRPYRSNARFVWLGKVIETEKPDAASKVQYLVVHSHSKEYILESSHDDYEGLFLLLQQVETALNGQCPFETFKKNFMESARGAYNQFDDFLQSYSFRQLQEAGLLIV